MEFKRVSASTLSPTPGGLHSRSFASWFMLFNGAVHWQGPTWRSAVGIVALLLLSAASVGLCVSSSSDCCSCRQAENCCVASTSPSASPSLDEFTVSDSGDGWSRARGLWWSGESLYSQPSDNLATVTRWKTNATYQGSPKPAVTSAIRVLLATRSPRNCPLRT